MEAFIRSASVGPPRREESMSGLRPRAEASAVSGLEFWMLHLSILFMLGSIVVEKICNKMNEELIVYSCISLCLNVFVKVLK